MTYTEMELKVIEAIRYSLNYDSLEDNLSDNCTCLDVKEVAQQTGLEVKSVKGIFGSLEKKGLMYVEISNINHKVMMVTEEGLREYYRLFENSTENEESQEEKIEMIKVIERATGNEFKANKIEGGYEVFTLEGEKYKKLKDSTFKKYFKPAEKAEEKTQEAEEPVEEVSEEKRAKMIEKIKKVLKLAQDNPSMEEGLAAALQAQKLMHKYNIHKDEVELEEIRDEITSVFSNQKHDSHLKAWRKNLAAIVARNFRCKCYMRGQDVVFRGYKADAEIALDVYMNLYNICHKLGVQLKKKEKEETGTGKGVQNSFAIGFLKGVEEGLGEQCKALMIIVPKEVEEEFEEFSKNFKTSRGMAVNNIDGRIYEKGRREGKAAVKARQLENKEDEDFEEEE